MTSCRQQGSPSTTSRHGFRARCVASHENAWRYPCVAQNVVGGNRDSVVTRPTLGRAPRPPTRNASMSLTRPLPSGSPSRARSAGRRGRRRRRGARRPGGRRPTATREKGRPRAPPPHRAGGGPTRHAPASGTVCTAGVELLLNELVDEPVELAVDRVDNQGFESAVHRGELVGDLAVDEFDEIHAAHDSEPTASDGRSQRVAWFGEIPGITGVCTACAFGASAARLTCGGMRLAGSREGLKGAYGIRTRVGGVRRP